jgi:hypothetical protein
MGLGWGIVLFSVPVDLYRTYTDEYGGLRGWLAARRAATPEPAAEEGTA